MSFPFHLSQATHPSAKSVSCRPQGVSLMSPGAIALGQFGPVAPSVRAPPRYPVPSFGGVSKTFIAVCKGGNVFPNPFQHHSLPVTVKVKRDPHQQELSLQITLSVVLTACVLFYIAVLPVSNTLWAKCIVLVQPSFANLTVFRREHC